MRNQRAITMKEVRILGVDPGIGGGWAVLNYLGGLEYAGTFPVIVTTTGRKTHRDIDGAQLQSELMLAEPTHAFIEQVHSRPRQAGQFQFGVNTGVVLGVVQGQHIPVRRVTPQSWKAAYNIKRQEEETKADKKTEARMVASKIYPHHADLFKRMKDDGVAEAVLIALYGLSVITGANNAYNA